MITSFPNRVWEQTRNGWVSREATPQDHSRRAALKRLLTRDYTDDERDDLEARARGKS